MPLSAVSQGDPHVPAHNAERSAINALEVDVAKKIYKPNSPTLGSLLRFDGDNWVPSKMRLFEGNGTPEGVVAAPVGSRYVDATALSGSVEYFKASGSGNTGWVPLLASLPWTNVTLSTGWTHLTGSPGQTSMLQGVVYFRGRVYRTSGTSNTIGSLAPTMYPTADIRSLARIGAENDVIGMGVTVGGTLYAEGTMPSTTQIMLDSLSPFRRL